MMGVMTNGKIMICHQEPTTNFLLVTPEALFFLKTFLVRSSVRKDLMAACFVSQ